MKTTATLEEKKRIGRQAPNCSYFISFEWVSGLRPAWIAVSYLDVHISLRNKLYLRKLGMHLWCGIKTLPLLLLLAATVVYFEAFRADDDGFHLKLLTVFQYYTQIVY